MKKKTFFLWIEPTFGKKYLARRKVGIIMLRMVVDEDSESVIRPALGN